MHGGLSPDLQTMEQIRRVMRPTDVPDTGKLSFIQSPQPSSLANHEPSPVYFCGNDVFASSFIFLSLRFRANVNFHSRQVYFATFYGPIPIKT